MANDLTQDVFSAMHSGEQPLAIYRKTIVGKVHVVVLNPFTDIPEGVILEGNSDDSFVSLWTPKALAFFEKLNKKHIERGKLAKTLSNIPKKPLPNVLSDEEVDNLLNSPFLTLKARVAKFTDSGPALRLLNRARELEKSEKIIKFLEKTASTIELAKLGE